MRSNASQLEWLSHDITVYLHVIRSNPKVLAPLMDTSDPIRHNYHEVLAGMFWTALDHAAGIVTLLDAKNRAALLPVARSLLESSASLAYLASHPDKMTEAAVFKAYGIIRELEWPQTPEGLAERQEILTRMPSEVVSLARKRARSGRGWSGRSFRTLLKSISIRDDDYDMYAYLSEHSHARGLPFSIGIEVDPREGRRLRLGNRFAELEIEHAANFARRILLVAYWHFWTAFKGPEVKLPTEDPREWALLNVEGTADAEESREEVLPPAEEEA